jgi:hypothetical protein
MKESLAMLLKTNGGKMFDFVPVRMLMKTKELYLYIAILLKINGLAKTPRPRWHSLFSTLLALQSSS